MSKVAVARAARHARRILAPASLLAFAACGGTLSPTEPVSTAGQWGTPEILEANVTSAAFPRVQVDPVGRGLAVWEVAGGIAARRFDAAGGWQELPLLPAADDQVTGLGLNPSGDTLITWSERESARPQHVTLWARRGNLDAGFGPAERLDADDPDADFANFSMDASLDPAGNAIAAWAAFPAFANRYETDRGWQGPHVLSAGPTNAPRVATDAAGNGIVVWQETLRGAVARFFPGRGWTPDDDYDRYEAGGGTGDVSAPRLALSSTGRGFIGWLRQTPQVRAFSSATLGLGPAVVLGGGTGPGDLRLAVNDQGDAVAVWEPGFSELWASTFDPSSGWATAERLVSAEARGFDVAMDATGNAILVFGEWDGTRDVMRARRHAPGSGWGPPRQIDAGGQSISPALAVDPSGNALLVWTELLPSSAKTVWANRFAIVTTR